MEGLTFPLGGGRGRGEEEGGGRKREEEGGGRRREGAPAAPQQRERQGAAVKLPVRGDTGTHSVLLQNKSFKVVVTLKPIKSCCKGFITNSFQNK